jgi:hypothetical protein
MRMTVTARDEYSRLVDDLRLKTAQLVQSATHPTDLAYSDPVMVYRTGSRRWEGPYRYVSEDEHGFYCISSHGETKLFQRPCVRRYAAGLNYDQLGGPASVVDMQLPRDGVPTTSLGETRGITRESCRQ